MGYNKTMEKIRFYMYGIILGIANVIPGVSGGTMMVILNIYDPLILAFSKERIRESIPFLLLIGGGTLTGILLFSNGITFLIQHFEIATMYGFMGLVVGSIPLLWKKARYEKLKKKNLVPFFIALFFMLGLLLVEMMAEPGQGAFDPERLSYPALAGWLFLSAIVSTIGMILPGISGSFVMLMLGAYFITMEAVSTFDMAILLPVGAGILLGGYFGVKVIGTLIKDHPQALYMGILGLMIGSIGLLYPGFEMSSEGAAALGFLVLGTVVSWYFGKYGH